MTAARLRFALPLVLAACPATAPRVREARISPGDNVGEPGYLVWTRSNDTARPTYETMLVSLTGDVLARREGVYIAVGNSLFAVRVAKEAIPSLACKAELFFTPRAELPRDALEDQNFERIELIDVGSGRPTRTVNGDGATNLSPNDGGFAREVGWTRMDLEGSVGSSLSILETSETWPCGSWRATYRVAHGVDLASGKPVDFGGCTAATMARAQAELGAEVEAHASFVSDLTCVGVSLARDAGGGFVGVHHRRGVALPSSGIGFHWTVYHTAVSPLPNAFGTTQPPVVRRVLDAWPAARGWSEAGTTAIGLFRRGAEPAR